MNNTLSWNNHTGLIMKKLNKVCYIIRNAKTYMSVSSLKVIYYVNKNPTDATVCRYLFTAKLLYMFQVSQHPSSGVLKTVPASSGTGHTTCTATPLQRGLIGTRWRGVAVQVVLPVPEAAGTVFTTPDDGCCDTRNM